jgi:hypothetical protein
VGFTLPAIAPGKSLDLLFAPVVAKNGEADVDGAAKNGVLKLSFKLSAEGVSADLTKDDATPIAHGQSAIVGGPTAQTIEVERRGTFIIVRINGKDEPQRTLLAARVR